jgi:hypothetical protein
MVTPAALPPLPFNPGRVRTYLVRLPLFTRLVLLIILAFWVLELQTMWSVVQWGALIPDEIGLGTSMFDPRWWASWMHADRLKCTDLIPTRSSTLAFSTLCLMPLLLLLYWSASRLSTVLSLRSLCLLDVSASGRDHEVNVLIGRF